MESFFRSLVDKFIEYSPLRSPSRYFSFCISVPFLTVSLAISGKMVDKNVTNAGASYL